MRATTLLLALSVSLAGCGERQHRHNGPPAPGQAITFVGDVTASASTLRLGRDSYVRHCAACHGLDGDGRGVSSPGLRPPPRDFRTPIFKFAGVIDGMPHDEDIARIVQGGLHGTAMLDWDIPDEHVYPMVQYIKTFSPEGEYFRDTEGWLGTRVIPTDDPWGEDRRDEAIEKGEAVYHGLTTCQSCHPAYGPKDEVWAYMTDYDKVPSFRDGMYRPEPKETDFTRDGVAIKIMPPDFTWDRVRSVREGHEHEDLYRVIASGIPGTAMPTWKDSIPEEDLWALVYYVESLIEIRHTPEARQMREALLDQPEFVPPEDKREEGAGEEGEGDETDTAEE